MTTDNRTEDQKVAAVRASMTMAGYTMTTRDEEDVRRGAVATSPHLVSHRRSIR